MLINMPNQPSEKKKILTVQLPKDLLSKIDALAQITERSRNQIITMFCDLGIAKEEGNLEAMNRIQELLKGRASPSVEEELSTKPKRNTDPRTMPPSNILSDDEIIERAIKIQHERTKAENAEHERTKAENIHYQEAQAVKRAALREKAEQRNKVASKKAKKKAS